MEEEIENIDFDKLMKELRGIPPKYITIAIIICLLLLGFYLGFIYGFNDAFHKQEDYYELKMTRHCICQETPDYSLKNIKPLDISELNKK